MSDLELQLQQVQTKSNNKETSRLLAVQAELKAAKLSLENHSAQLTETVAALTREKETVEKQRKELEGQVKQLIAEGQKRDETVHSCERNLKALESRLQESQELNESKCPAATIACCCPSSHE